MPSILRPLFLGLTFVLAYVPTWGQGTVEGTVTNNGSPLGFSATVYIEGSSLGSATDADGNFKIAGVESGPCVVVASAVGYVPQKLPLTILAEQINTVNFELEADMTLVGEVVVSGTMKEVSKLESAVPVEVYSPKFFKANPTPSVYAALQTVNGVRPQINCSVCNTGDIHINGLEGPYTMVLIDGMPIVSGLSTVYGLNGIPASLIERVEIVKGPASTLYGSEAVGGLINIITKTPSNVPKVAMDVFGTSWGEINADAAVKFRAGTKAEAFVGVNAFHFGQRVDKDKDGFTDMTLQDRVSVFNKWNFLREDNRLFTLAGRLVHEDRFGGQIEWEEDLHRGGTEVYGESIYTDRWEFFGAYELPLDEGIQFQFSANGHHQNSVYGDTRFLADQRIGFGQLVWDKALASDHAVLAGLTMRYTYYDDNTPATASPDSVNALNQPARTFLPGLFVQDEFIISPQSKLLLGMRYDRNSIHGNIFTPRLNFRWNSVDKRHTLRLSFGTGYRVANVFTEDHAALSGVREVIIEENLRPETSVNGNLNYVRRIYTRNQAIMGVDATAFYTHFDNKIIPDYDSNPSQIRYANLGGNAVSQGVSLNLDVLKNGFKLLTGVTVMNVYSELDGIRFRQELTEQFSGTWSIGYTFSNHDLRVDYTGNVYSPMELATLTDDNFIDPRPAQSPWYSIQNVQITKGFGDRSEAYVGAKNLLNWTPWNNLPPGVSYMGNTLDPFGANPEPGVLAFDPSYVYGPNQGLRGFFGVRWNVN